MAGLRCFWIKHDNVYIYQPISVVCDLTLHGVKNNSASSYLDRLVKVLIFVRN